MGAAAARALERDDGALGDHAAQRGVLADAVPRYRAAATLAPGSTTVWLKLGNALTRMHEANSYLSAEQAYHLTQHAVMRNEDGSFSWKFDPHLHAWPPEDMPYPQLEALWKRIECPTRLIYGNDSWASNPEKDGRIAQFRNATVTAYDNAGHWVHHDRFDDFLGELREFL